jgi:sugar lactone lactonase YvrE
VADVFARIRDLFEEEAYGLYYLTPDNVLIDVSTGRMPSNTLALHRDDRRLSQFTTRTTPDSASPESGG